MSKAKQGKKPADMEGDATRPPRRTKQVRAASHPVNEGFSPLSLGVDFHFGFRDFFKSRDNWLILALLVVIPLGLYWQITGFEFVWDDLVLHLRHLQPTSTTSLTDFWIGPIDKQYTPVTFSFWAFLIWLGGLSSSTGAGLNPFVLHLANLIVHILVGLMVFWLLYNAVRNKWAALAGALFFSVHPIQVHTVAWVSEMRGLLGTTLGMIGMILYLVSAKQEKPSSREKLLYIMSMIFFGLCMTAKPAAIITPLFVLAVEVLVIKSPLKRSLIRISPGLALMIPFALVTILGQKQYTHETIEVPIWIHPLIWMDTINFYLYKIANPTWLAVSYARTPISLVDGKWLYIGWIIPLTIGVVLWWFRKKHLILAASALLFVIGYLPTSGLLSFPYQAWSTVSDRYLYLSMIGASLVVSYLIWKLNNRWVLAAAFLACCALAAQSFLVQIPSWKNSLTLWNHCILVTPNESRAYKQRGNEFGKRGNLLRASMDLNKAIKLNPSFPKAYSDRGAVWIKIGQLDKALADLNRAIELNPNLSEAYLNRASLYLAFNQLKNTIEDLTKVIEIDPSSSIAYRKRAEAYHQTGLNELAMKDLEKMRQLGHSLDPALFNKINQVMQSEH